MLSKRQSYAKLFWQLLRTDFFIYKNAVLDAFIDCTIWFTCLIVVFAYVFPLIGLAQTFGAYIAVGAIVSCIFWDTWATATGFISDIEGEKTIEYFLTLPLPNSLILIKQIVSYAIKGGLPALLILPLGKLFLLGSMDLSQFSLIKYLLIFTLTALLIGAFSLFVSSTIQNLHHLGKVGIRYLFPMWFFGGSNYPWETVYKLSPTFAYLHLLNPLLYAMEGIHAAVLGQTGYLPYWICAIMLTVFIGVFTVLGIWNLKKRLDFV